MNYAVMFIFDEKKDDYQVSIPDLPGCGISAKSIDLGIEEITKSIKSHLAILAEYGEKVPNATSLELHRKNYMQENPYTFAQAFWAIVSIDITPYLGKSHKINVTLPELLISQIDEKVSKSTDYKTRSGFIASACFAELAK
ncbi:type II toxin-antitoxin system HicB family antitoxin [Colwellia sp. E2M01]|uniref:type II toxin-antitoxin system HicB family antitoxin n=1 Tax=Colwellia sp. E2M01 TaxID=2841561 RepID=UPI001C09B974|nr:type II toxin-antitoxin system HicB family antitoxin [Colwellia sp. E2M01]MBU2870548.1 type II toxin-antitoxin system HicB family antitoxin [Colwellia sp. E2M01]